MKRAIVLLTFILTTQAFSQNLNDSLLLYYTFDGNSIDISSNGFNGIQNATLTSDRFGNPNKAYSFNGFDQYLDFPPNVPQLKPELPVSFSFWLKLDDLQPENTVLFTTDFAQNNHTGVWMNISSTGLLAVAFGDALGNTTSYNRRTKVGTTMLEIDMWYHIAVVVRDAYDMDLYLDCINDEGMYSGSGGSIGYTDCQGSIGRKDAHIALPPYYFKGAIDDFRYWNRALTISDIDSLCSTTTTISESIALKQNEFKIFPNPTSDILNIETDLTDLCFISIFNSLGKLIYSGPFKTNLNISRLTSGIYILKALNSTGTVVATSKFVVRL